VQARQQVQVSAVLALAVQRGWVLQVPGRVLLPLVQAPARRAPGRERPSPCHNPRRISRRRD
jgi:hypothetical protein